MTDNAMVIARLNARLQPIDRRMLYEDPLEDALQEAGFGAVTGGGTQQDENGEIVFCEVEIELDDVSERTLEIIQELLERLGAPKGLEPAGLGRRPGDPVRRIRGARRLT